MAGLLELRPRVGAFAAQALRWISGKLCLGQVLQVVLPAIDVECFRAEADLQEGLRLH